MQAASDYRLLDDEQETQLQDDQDNRSTKHNPLRYLTKTPGLSQTFIRITALILSVGVIIGAFVAIPLVHERVETYTFDGTKKLELYVDYCDVVVDDSTNGRYYLHVIVERHNDIKVKMENNKFMINNTKDLAERYTNYRCIVHVMVPTNGILPETVIVAEGRRRSQLIATSRSWGDNRIKIMTTYSTTQFFAVLKNCTFGTLDAQAGSGFIWVDNSHFSGPIVFNFTQGSLWLRSQDSLLVDMKEPLGASACLVANSMFCLSDPSSPIDNCTQLLLAPHSSATTGKAIILVSNNTNLHAVVQTEDQNLSDLQLNEEHPNFVNISMESISRVLVPFSVPPAPEVVYFRVLGPGSPEGLWSFTKNNVYNYFSTPFLQLSTFGLLKPQYETVNVWLAPAACPGLNNDGSVENLVPIYKLFTQLLKSELKSQTDVVAFLQSTQLGGRVWRLKQDPDSGEYYNAWSAEKKIYLAVAILNGILVGLTGIGGTYVIFRNAMIFRRKKVEAWGKQYYGEKEFELISKQVHAKADIFFMMEFVVGFPGKQLNVLKSMLTVWIHLLAILIPVAPLYVACYTYGKAVEALDGKIPIETVVGLIISWSYLLCALLCLLLYYLNNCVPWKIRYIVSWPFFILGIVVTMASVFYIIHIIYWLLLGALIKPDDILPFASVIIISVAQFILTVMRVKELLAILREEEEEKARKALQDQGSIEMSDVAEKDNERAIKEAKRAELLAPKQQPTTIKLTGRLGVQDSMALIQSSQIFELSESTIRERIVNEIVRFIILLLFFLFVLLGFVAFRTTSLATGISTGLIFLAGGGINLPTPAQKSSNATKLKRE